METYYLVDYENVHEDGLRGIKELTEKDHVCLMFTPNALKISLDVLAGIRADFKAIKAPAGKQSLDMHIGTFLGFLVGSNSDRKNAYVIISKDTDFDGIIRFWNASGLGEFSRQQAIRVTELAIVQNQTPVQNGGQNGNGGQSEKTSSRNRRTSSRRKSVKTAVVQEEKPSAVRTPEPETVKKPEPEPERKPEPAPVPEKEEPPVIPEAAAPAGPAAEPVEMPEKKINAEAAAPEAEAVKEEPVQAAESPATEEAAPAEEAAPVQEKPAEEAKPEESKPRRGRPRRRNTRDKASEEVKEAAKEEPVKAETVPEKVEEKPAEQKEQKPAEKNAEKPEQKPAENPEAGDDHGKADLKTQVNNRIVRILRDNQVETGAAQAVASLVVSNLDKKNVKQLAYRGIVNKFGQKTGLLYYNLIRKEI